jgi:hypothetical protein
MHYIHLILSLVITDISTTTNQNLNQVCNNKIRLNSYINRGNDDILKVTHFTDCNQKVVLTYVSPSNNAGCGVYKDNLEKSRNETNDYLYNNNHNNSHKFLFKM